MQVAIRARKLLALVDSLELRVFLAAQEKVSIWPVEVACHCQRTRHLPGMICFTSYVHAVC